MTCHDFWSAWQARLDDRSPTLWAEPDSRLVAHAAVCRACREQSGRFQALEQALALAGPPPSLDRDRTRQLVATLREVPTAGVAGHRTTVARFRVDARRWSGLAAAAMLLGFWLVPRPEPNPIAGRIAPAPAPGHDLATVAFRPLTETIAEATVVSLDLARETSAPAARLGRQLLGSASPEPARSGPDPAQDPAPGVEDSGLWRTVGDRMATGVRPLSDPARRAFSFLTPPAALAQVSDRERGL